MLKKIFLPFAIQYTGKILVICFLLTLFTGKAYALYTFTWTGGTSTAWETAGNWTKTGTGNGHGYPGLGITSDIVRIGVTTTFTRQPTLSTSVTVASIELGSNDSGTGSTAMTLTINNGVILTVTGAVQQDHDSRYGDNISSTITGLGSLICGSFKVGSTTTPTNNGGPTQPFVTSVTSQINDLTITGTLNLNSHSLSKTAGRKDFYNSVFNLNSGTLNVANITISASNFQTGNTAKFTMGATTTANTLNISGSITVPANIGGSISFLSAAANTSFSKVNYNGTTAQVVYTSANAFVVSTPTTYGNLDLSGAGAKTINATPLTVGGNWTTGGGAINLNTNNPAVTVSGNWVNTASVTEGTGTVDITGNLTNNSGGGVIKGGLGATNVTGITGNAGTITVNSENMTYTGLVNNSGTYAGGAGSSKFNGGLTNTASVTAGAGAITITDLTNTSTFTGNSAAATTSVTGTLDNSGTINANAEAITFTGTATNTGTYTGGTGISTFNGAYINSGGTFTAGTADVNFNGDYTNSATFTSNAAGKIIFGGAGAQTLTDNSTNGTTVINMFVQGSGTKTMSGSKGFSIASTGILTMAGTATLDGGDALTLISDANSTATIAAIPAGCGIIGNVNVQRFIKGSSDLSTPDLSKRGYRLISSAVYTGTDPTSGAHVSDLLYLTNSVYVSGAGGAANGFNVSTTQNPTLYLFREDIAPPPNATTIFTTGYNWKGVAKINNSPTYLIGTQAKNTTANVVDATVTIPVGNGVLFFFRGDKTTSLIAPLTPPNDAILTQTGTLNTGTINVRLWYADATNNLGNNLSYTSALDTGANGAVLRGGWTLVGNPYPATINWEKYNMNGANSSIYGSGGLNSKIYFFNPVNKQYNPYFPDSQGDTTSINPGTSINGSSNMIASGQGFFIKATAAGSQSLTFRESAKTSTQPTAASLNQLMGAPKAFAAAPKPLLRLKMSMDSINTDEIVIRLNSQSSTKFAENKDAEDLDGSALVSLSAFSSDKARLAIYSTPFPGQQQQVIPLLTDATASGLYKLERTQLDNLPALYEVWLKDALMADSLDLKANATYQFTIDKNNPATFGSTRFTLVIRQNAANAYRLLDFNASRAGNSSHVEVVWHTVNEQNYTNFTVERSNDGGTTFDVVGGMQGTGAGVYSLVDKNTLNGQNLYRLKQEDLNNTITYSKVVAVLIDSKNNKDSDNKLNIYPNPATNNISLSIAEQSKDNTSYSIRFMSSSGIMVKQITSSQPNWQGNISNLQPGTYLVRVLNNKTQNLVGQNKFVKL